MRISGSETSDLDQKQKTMTLLMRQSQMLQVKGSWMKKIRNARWRKTDKDRNLDRENLECRIRNKLDKNDQNTYIR